MSAIAVIGAQWGDEGKGKVVDYLAPDLDWAIRYQGGANAGHTVVVGERKTVLHLVPSAILDESTRCGIASGVVVDPLALLEEIKFLEKEGVAVEGRLFLSPGCHLVLPHHKAIDEARERARGRHAIGTTGRGIGPAYSERAERVGVRAGDLLDRPGLVERVREAHRSANHILARVYDAPPVPDAAIEPIVAGAQRLAAFVDDVGALARAAIARDETVLLEGAQGTMLDLDHGTYPFVTSSNTTSGAAAASVGIAPWAIRNVLAVFKAYVTRVGAGPLPSEVTGDVADRLVARGCEYGSTTGRRRRVGWFDVPAARFAVEVNGATALALTKLDVLDDSESIPVCVAYEVGGRVVERFPSGGDALAECRPVLEEMAGWMEPTGAAREVADLPARAQDYLRRLAELAGAPIALVSVGSSRDATFRAPSTALPAQRAPQRKQPTHTTR
jgi:adenylosuccinate synthase